MNLAISEQQRNQLVNGQPIRLTDIDTKQEFVVLSVELYESLQTSQKLDELDPSLYEFQEIDDDPE